MPIDSKRNPRPDNSVSYDQFVDPEDNTARVYGAGRSHGRGKDELRPLYVRLGTTLHAQGSCYLELGATKVSAAVYGPREVARRSEFSTSGQLSCELRFAPFAGRRRRGHLPDDQQRELSQTLRTAVEPAVCLHEFPKSSVDVFVHVLQDDGGALAAAITAAGAALADANVPMYDLVTAAALRHSGGADLMDPDGGDPAPPADPEPDGAPFSHVTVGYLTQLQQVSCLYSEGLVSAAALNSSVRSLVTACQQLYVVVREKLLKKAGRPTANGTS